MKIHAIYRGLFCAGLLSMGLQAGTITLGNPAQPGTGSCDPFGCAVFFSLGTYQQVYTGSAFSSVVDIDQLTFFDSQVQNNGKHDQGTYTFSFSYTGANPGNLNLQSPGNNINGVTDTFFSGTLPSLVSGSDGSRMLVISGTPFEYDPSLGNLLLTITITGAVDQKPPLYLDEAQTTAQTGNAYFPTTGPGGGNDPGLITQFTVSQPSTGVPEPASFLLLLSGIGLVGFGWRRRNSL